MLVVLRVDLLSKVLQGRFKELLLQDLFETERKPYEIEVVFHVQLISDPVGHEPAETVLEVFHKVEGLYQVTHLHGVVLGHEEGEVYQRVQVVRVHSVLVGLATAVVLEDVVFDLVG